MPSPFPGMDPYLEEPDLWPDLHAELIGDIRAELNPLLRPNYMARIEQRVFNSDENDAARDLIIPDVRVIAGGPRGGRRRRRLATPATPSGPAAAVVSAAAAAAVIEPVEVETQFDDEVRQSFLRVMDVRDRSVVTVIEVLSPSNKVPGSAGRRSYQENREQVMSSPSHWVEIDLLRAGARMAVRGELPPYDYLVHVSRAGQREGDRRRGQAWPVPLAHPLPKVPVPLRDGDGDVWIDLQTVLDRAYDRAGYDVDVDYAADPVPPLAGDAAGWARRTVAAWRAAAVSAG